MKRQWGVAGKEGEEVNRTCTNLFLLCLVLQMVSLGGCTGTGPVPARTDRFSGYLKQVDACSSPRISEIEKRLRLNSPADVRALGFTDPMWWFLYRIDGYEVALGANTERKEFDFGLPDRQDFFFTGYWYVRPLDSKEMAHPTWSQKTVDILRNHGGSAQCWYSQYLGSLDRTAMVSIPDLELEMRLLEPVNVEVPAFIDPMWWFFYDVDGYVVVLTALPTTNVEGSEEAMKNRDKFVFAGYWKFGAKDERKPR